MSRRKRRRQAGSSSPTPPRKKPQEGEVVAAGTGARNESGEIHPLEVKAGDKILFGKWSGTEVKVDGEDLLIMKESDIPRDRRLTFTHSRGRPSAIAVRPLRT